MAGVIPLLVLAPQGPLVAANAPVASKPNILLIITDDQGYGELSRHGNPVLKTPHLDRLHNESVRFTDFHVAPMCTPTRGQLMTGVDCLRNRAMNVSSGRTLLRRDLPTMSDLFAAAGYATGMFGKWHLGDNHPYRPQDRGFHESLWYPSSHIGSATDSWDNDYFDDTYWHNGRRRRFTGYTTDVFFREAMRWMLEEARAGKPFFGYLATAAPHAPHLVPADYRETMEAAVAKASLPKLSPAVREQLTRYLAMIANIDDNMGRLDDFLRETRLRDNTIVVFLTDNGSTFGPRYLTVGHDREPLSLLSPCEWRDVFLDQGAQVRRGDRKNGVWHLEVARAGQYEFELRRWPRERETPLSGGLPPVKTADGSFPAGASLPIAKARLKVAVFDRTANVAATDTAVRFRVPLSAGPAECQTWFYDGDGLELCGAYYVYVQRVQTSPRVKAVTF